MAENKAKEGKVFIVSAPAGTGKTTLVDKLLRDYPSEVVRNVSYTTRCPRPGEVPGRDYHFVSLRDFQQMVEKGELLDHVTLYGHYYGTSKRTVDQLVQQGKRVILVIDTQGGISLQKREYPAVYIFLAPPSMQELRNRLFGRSTETSNVIEERLDCAEREMEDGRLYDHQIINDDLEEAYTQLKKIIIEDK